MRSSRRWTDRFLCDAGSASLEFIGAGLLLLVPVVYLVLVLSALQSGALAVDGGARQATRIFVQQQSYGQAKQAAARAVEVTLSDYGVDRATASIVISCRPRPSTCLTRRGFVTITVTAAVRLPLVPPVLDLAIPSTIPVSATATEQVSRFWGSR